MKIGDLSKLVIFALAIIVLIGGYYLVIKYREPVRAWDTYTDIQNGFSLKYPSTWNKGQEPVVGGDIVVLSPVSVEQIGTQVQAVSVYVTKNPKHLTSMEYYDQVVKPDQAGSVCTDPSINTNVPSSLQGLDVTIIEGLCGVLTQGPRMVAISGDHIVVVSSSFVDEVNNNLIYEILSTFKFIK